MSQEGIEVRGTPDTQIITAKSRTIRTLDALLEAAEVDLDVWEVKDWIANKWDMAAKTHRTYTNDDRSYESSLTALELWQVKATFRRKTNYNFDMAMSRVLKRLEKCSPKLPAPPRRRFNSPRLVDLCLYDVHFGKLAWSPETNSDYDLKIAKSCFQNAGVDILKELKDEKIGRFHLAVGNDFFHFDNAMQTTTSGTQMDADGRYPKIIEYGFDGLCQLVMMCHNVAPVDITWVPGNHDYHSSYHICRELQAYFRNTPTVSVDVSPSSRKYRTYGVNLLGYTHGKDEKPQDLGTIMPTEKPKEWAECHHRVWNLGHIHTRKALTTTDLGEYKGVSIKFHPSLAGTDAWHHQKGYIGNKRAAAAHIYDFKEGDKGCCYAYARN